MSDDVEETLDLLQRHYAHKLSAWEEGFLTSIEDQWNMSGFLTDRQREKLQEIWEKCSDQGRDPGRSWGPR